MTHTSPIRTTLFVIILFLTLTGLTGVGALTAQADPAPAASPTPTEDQRNDASIPPLVGGSPATPKTAVPAPRGPANPGTRFQDSPNAPAITLWYGPTQTFGPNGDPQKWVNIVGNVAGAVSLTYSLNGSPAKTLAIGPNNSRLGSSGDFNIELNYIDLNAGNNTVTITATDSLSVTTQAIVTVNYQARPGAWTPGTYTIDWSTASKVTDVAQVVDGNWVINAGKAKTAAAGFDRLIAIGDMSWRDYTVTVPVTVHSMDQNKSPGVGFIVRWWGHFDNGAGLQPLVGWKRLGAMAWYRYEKATATEGLQLLGDGGATLGTKGFSLTLGTTYMYKVSVTSNADPKKPATYRFKVWPQAQTEPAAWDFELPGVVGEPPSGSVVLLAHHADVSFGNATVMLNSVASKPKLTLGTMGTGTGSVAANPQKATYRFGEDVSLMATANAGSTFVDWQGDAKGTLNPTTIEMFADRNAKAHFTDPTVQTPLSDDFNGCVLNPSLWTFVDPLGDSTVTMSGGHAEISVPAGTTHDLWINGRNAPRIMQFADNNNFEFSVKFDSSMDKKNQAQGILVEGDAQNYLRFNYLHDGSSYRIQAYTFTGGVETNRITNDNKITIGPPMYLRVKRIGDFWNLFYSANGSTWSLAAGFSYSLGVTSIGVYAGNSNVNPAHTAKIDYFFNSNSPISPEDNARKLNVTIDGSGSVQRTPDKENYACDEVVTLTPVPAPGYKFDSWSGALTGNANPAQLTMNATKDVVARFVSDTQYTVTLSANGAGTVTKSPEKATYGAGETVTLEATPNLGNTFVNWLVNGVPNTANPLVVTVNSNMTVVGNFAPAPQRTLTVTTVGNGTITLNPPGGAYPHGQQVTLTASPGANASFTGWSGSLTGTTNPVTITMDADKSITGTFLDNIYTLTTLADPVGAGSVSASPSKPAYYQGEIVQLTPLPAAGYVFAGWEGDLSGAAVPGVLTMAKNSTVTAKFVPTGSFSITINISGGTGTILKTPPKSEYAYGEQVTLEALAGPGYEFLSWSGDLTGSDNPAVITVTKNMIITANFGVAGIYSLTILPSDHGSITVDPVRDLYTPGELVELRAVPDLGYVLTAWGDDGAGSTANPLVLTMDGDKTVSATFETAPLYTLNVTANGPGSVATDPAGTQFTAGSSVTLTATADSGYIFTGWSGDLTSNLNSYQLLIDGNKNIVANFGLANDVVSDDFAGCGTLNPMWTWVDPLGQANYTMTGTQAKITIPAGVDYEIWKDGNNSARLVQEVANTDFEIIVKFDSPVTQGYQTQGILIETDDDTFLRADFHHDGTNMRFFSGTIDNVNAKVTNRFSEVMTPPASSEMYMRIQRRGDTFRLFYRFAESDPWTGFKGSNFKFPMEVNRVGIFASTQSQGGQPAPGHTALFDYFFNADAPISPEDSNAPGINVTVAPEAGAGIVTLTPANGPYACGQQVQLRATPTAGWRFFSWSVDLNGSAPTQTITVSKKHNVTANFIQLTGFKLFLPVAIR